MSFADQVSSLSQACFAALGEAATYAPAGEAEVSTRAKLQYGNATFGDHPPQASQDHSIASLPAADVPRCKRGDILTVNGTTYVVEHLVSRNPWVVRALVRPQ